MSAVRPLAGGTHASTHLAQTVNPERELALREFPAGDDAAAREARVLAALDGLDGLAPRLYRPGGDEFCALLRFDPAAAARGARDPTRLAHP